MKHEYLSRLQARNCWLQM